MPLDLTDFLLQVGGQGEGTSHQGVPILWVVPGSSDQVDQHVGEQVEGNTGLGGQAEAGRGDLEVGWAVHHHLLPTRNDRHATAQAGVLRAQKQLREIADGAGCGYNYGAMRYRKPPLVEAVFEVFAVPTKWSEETPEIIETAFREVYSGKREVLKPVGLHFQMGPGLALQGLKTEQEPDRVRLWTPDGDRMVQFAPNMCALNILPEYLHYEEHRPELERLTKKYLELAEPTATAQLGQRYINRVRLPVGGRPDNFFKVYPAVPEEIGGRNPPFSMQVEIQTLGVGGNVVLTLTAKGVEDGHPVYVLDVYARSQAPGPASWDYIREWQDEAHEAVKAAFEMAITEAARDLFGRED